MTDSLCKSWRIGTLVQFAPGVWPKALACPQGWTPSLRSAELWHGASSGRGKIDTRAGRDDTGRIDSAVAAVIVPLDMIKMHRLGHAGHLIERARIVPQFREVHQAITIALEVAVVDRIETCQRSEQPPVRFR